MTTLPSFSLWLLVVLSGFMPASLAVIQTRAGAADPELVVNAAKSAVKNIPRFGCFEQSFTHRRNHDNPYREVAATATLAPSGGPERTIPLFWDGGANWKMRF